MLNSKFTFKSHRSNSGFTFIEVLIAAAIFMVVVTGIYQGYVSIMQIARAARVKTDAMLLANERIEVIRNMPYQDVGIVSGIPAGTMASTTSFFRDGNTFQITASVRNIDDPFDGTVGSSTHDDLAPADYKQVELDVSCPTCRGFAIQTVRTTIAPKNLENTAGTGALFVKVFDASGNPVPQASVHIENTAVTPHSIVDEVTDNSGMFQLVGAPPANQAYWVKVTKSGYSTDQSYPPAGPPTHPVISYATVAADKMTQVSLAIDRLSNITVKTTDSSCNPFSGITFKLQGSKIIGTNPTTYKVSQNYTTDSSGTTNLSNMEWDTYNFTVSTTSGTYLVAGSLPLLPTLVAPGSTQNVYLILHSYNPKALLVTVTDSGTGLPLASSTVSISGNSFSDSQMTNRGYFSQTDWSGGSGQVLFANKNQFYSSDSNVDYSTANQLKLRLSLGQYVSSGNLISSVFDTGATGATYYNLNWAPGNQATTTGTSSVKFQIASGNDPATTTWHWFGPDGTAATYYTALNSAINPIHNGDRYMRYKLYLTTADPTVTPKISNVSITYSTACMPFGQAFWSGLSSGNYNITVSHDNYRSYSGSVNVSGAWQGLNVPLSSQ